MKTAPKFSSEAIYERPFKPLKAKKAVGFQMETVSHD